jgi:hypothetical protein
LGPQPLTQAPLWQVAVPAVQAWQPWPPVPQARSVWWVRVTQVLPSQQPWAQVAAVQPPPSVVSQTRLLLQKSPPGHWATQAVPLQQPLQVWAVQVVEPPSVVEPASVAAQAPAWQDWSAEHAEQSAPFTPQSASPVPTRQLPPAVQQPEQFEGLQVPEEQAAAKRATAPRAARAIRVERVMG